ncbi:MAG: transglutaminase family protein, partial [Leptospiraceae bacterium]|nr:transglutaminase family protein [Leptospiraceae bacterium]
MENESHAKTREVSLLLSCFAETTEQKARKQILKRLLDVMPFGDHPMIYIDALGEPVLRLKLRELFAEFLNRRKLTEDLLQALKSSDSLDLETGVFLISRMSGSIDLRYSDFTRSLDELAEPLMDRLEDVTDEMDRLDLFREYLFVEQGFRGNTENYYDPANSYLNSVLETKKGIPVSLSVLAILVGQRAGLPIEGVNLPGHFIVKYESPELKLYLDPFNEGSYLTEEECYHFLIRQGIQPDGNYLGSANALIILKRMYRN